MVYFRRRQRRHPKPKATVTITDLPDELILDVLSYLDMDSVLKARVCNKHLFFVCGQAVHTRLRVLYIHPTRLSLRQAVAICNSAWAEGIKEVCLLGRVLWDDMLTEARNARLVAGEIDPARGYGTNKFKTWPPTMPPLEKTRDSDSMKLVGRSPSFVECYDVLLRALRNLSSLHALSFATSCSHTPGFNQSLESTAQSHALACRNSPKQQSRVNASRDRDSPRWCELHALFAILANSRGACITLRISDELPFAALFVDKLGNAKYRYLTNSLERLVTLELQLHGGPYATEWQGMCRRLLESTQNLENLSLKYQHDSSRTHAVTCESLASLFDEPDKPDVLPRLRSFKIASLLPRYDRGRCYRPLLQQFDIATFLTTYRETLRSVDFDSVTFAMPYHSDESIIDINTVSPVRACFDGLFELIDAWKGEGNRGEHFRWRINRFGQDPRCRKGFEATSLHVCAFDCGMYAPRELDRWTTTEMEDLAASRGADLDEESQDWTF
ncbi:hypothetical protein B0A48_03832 [Cryoendolithus antarcticus]|uniref:F-box domain-containing protein n=1 Tax=Cryoendolithus antarcticus TaxID=1507870 RepID=A0A1V8TGN4_9PEZI|nr:hypothetical protein B0A48_03832 [Cryoendolithus antarcticus]